MLQAKHAWRSLPLPVLVYNFPEPHAKPIRFVMFLFNYILFWQVADALDLAQATMAKVYQNLSWAVAYNVVAVPIAAGVLLPRFDLAMTPSLSGE